MTRLVRNAALLSAGGMLLASIAFANVPDPSKSTLGVGFAPGSTDATSIRLTGRNTALAGSPALPTGTVLGTETIASAYTVEIHDFANNPIAGSSVVIDFSSCAPAAGGDIEISCDQTLAVGQTYVSPSKVAGSTNAAGRFTFNVQGSAASGVLAGTAVVTTGLSCQSTLACTNAGCARVYADGVLISGTALRVTSWDHNKSSAGGRSVTGSEAAIISAEVARKTIVGFQKQRSDVNQDGNVTGGDASTVGAAAVLPTAGAFSVTSGPYCP